MQEKTSYQQLQPEERVALAGLKLEGLGVRQIGLRLGRSASTIRRELSRNSSRCGDYRSRDAQRRCMVRRQAARPKAKLDPAGTTWQLIVVLLGWKWSPQQIAATLRAVFPDQAGRCVSHETIYTTIYALARGELRRQLIACLRQGHRNRLPRSRGIDRRGQIPDRIGIHLRPPEIEDRLMPGHWEGDLIKGKGNASAVGVLVERSSRLVLLARMDDATAASALAGFSAKLNSIVAPMRRSLTYDQGREMSRHADLADRTGVNIYFCDPHSPWQRGTCENTNGLLRQYLPKGTDLSIYSQEALDEIADSLNNRPRATLDWKSPLQAFSTMLSRATQLSNSIH